jgi:hypothetical protein
MTEVQEICVRAGCRTRLLVEEAAQLRELRRIEDRAGAEDSVEPELESLLHGPEVGELAGLVLA